MFDFERLDVYQKAKQFNKEVYSFLKNSKTIDLVSKIVVKISNLSIFNCNQFAGKRNAQPGSFDCTFFICLSLMNR